MAITTGAELATAVANWTGRADLTSRIPEFVALAEAKMNRVLRTPEMETKDAAFSITGEYVAVPTGFLAARMFYLNDSDKTVLSFMPDDTQSDYFGTATGTPKYFSVVGSNFRFGPVPPSTYTATLVYYKAPASVSAGGSATNFILASHPDVYLYGSLLEAVGYLGDDPRVQLWLSAYSTALEHLKRQGSQMRWGGNSMAVRAA